MSSGKIEGTEQLSTKDYRSVVSDVSVLKAELKAFGTELDQVQGSVDKLAGFVQSGFNELRKELANNGRTNWGWILAAVSVLVAIVGAVGTAWVRPLQANDANFESRLNRIESRLDEDTDRSIRTSERLRVYEELGLGSVLGTKLIK